MRAPAFIVKPDGVPVPCAWPEPLVRGGGMPGRGGAPPGAGPPAGPPEGVAGPVPGVPGAAGAPRGDMAFGTPIIGERGPPPMS